ncbi:MAG: hypothetical protein PHX08_17620 [Lachnospiraceae bacterium]|nr:hypothetical protein [Lachnospiraceae bacterium]
MSEFKCEKCGSTQCKEGKIGGIATVQSINSKTGLGGSELIITFCKECGEVFGLTVKNPDAIK